MFRKTMLNNVILKAFISICFMAILIRPFKQASSSLRNIRQLIILNFGF